MKTQELNDLTVMTSRTVEDLMHENLATLDHEEVWNVYLTRQQKLIGTEMVSKGTLDKTAVD